MAKKNENKTMKVTDNDIEYILNVCTKNPEWDDDWGEKGKGGYEKFLSSTEKDAFDFGVTNALAALAAYKKNGDEIDEQEVSFQRVACVSAARWGVSPQTVNLIVRFASIAGEDFLDEMLDALTEDED